MNIDDLIKRVDEAAHRPIVLAEGVWHAAKAAYMARFGEGTMFPHPEHPKSFMLSGTPIVCEGDNPAPNADPLATRLPNAGDEPNADRILHPNMTAAVPGDDMWKLPEGASQASIHEVGRGGNHPLGEGPVTPPADEHPAGTLGRLADAIAEDAAKPAPDNDNDHAPDHGAEQAEVMVGQPRPEIDGQDAAKVEEAAAEADPDKTHEDTGGDKPAALPDPNVGTVDESPTPATGFAAFSAAHADDLPPVPSPVEPKGYH